MWKLAALLAMLVAFSEASFSEVNLKNNRYEGIVIAINPDIPEDPNLVQGLKDAWTEASRALWTATKQRAYFEEITILVPKSWTSGSYAAGKNQTYSSADVVIAAKNPAFGDSPYTVQYGECGSPGEYIHLTPTYVLDDVVVDDYGPRGKTLVHEWAHLRWGVFDESATEGYDKFYYGKNQEIEATRCPLAFKGNNYVIDKTTGETSVCQQSAESNWLPEEGCVFIPYEEQDEKLSTSILSHQYRDEAVTFCHDDLDDPTNVHNHEAPNEHNRLCDQRSVWDVIMSSTDFANNNNRPNLNLNPSAPTFRVVQSKTPRFVLVLDTSGSMGIETRFSDMITSANMFIQDFVQDGGAIGIVHFASQAQVLSYMREVHSQNDRDYLSEQLPKSPNGGTCIGCGISMGIDVLERYYGDASGGHIIVLTDGEETTSPMVADTRYDVISKEIVLDAIFFGSASNPDLWDLSIETNGEQMVNDFNDLLELMETFKSLSEVSDGDVYNEVFQVQGETYSLSPGETESGEVVLDTTVGKNTIFTFTWSQYSYAPSIVITDPNGGRQCSISNKGCPNSNVKIDDTMKTVQFKMPEIAMAGTWKYDIHADSHSETVNVMVNTMAANTSVDPIVVHSSLSAIDVTSGEPIVVNAQVTQGYKPILGAIIQAQITSTLDGSVTYLDLYDYGFAPDARKDDGVYSRYFTGYSSSGRYAVQVTVVGMGNTSSSSTRGSPAAFNYGYVASNGKVVLNPNAVGQTSASNEQGGTSVQDMDAFKRIESAGGFSYTGPANTPNNDVFPPSKVIDLFAKQKDSLDVGQGIVLTFTAPGDDLDEGRARSYEMRYTYDTPSTLSSSFTSGTQVTANDLISGDLSNPSVANTMEMFLMNLTDIPTDKDLVTVAFALRTTDDAGNTADVSNIAIVSLFLTPPPIACTDKNGQPISTDPFEKSGDCNNFYQCSNGELSTIPCKIGTVFNPDVGVCDHPDKVPSCKDAVVVQHNNDGTVIANSTNPTTTTQSSPSGKPTCFDADGNPMTTKPFPEDGNCEHYYQCSQGKLYEMACPPGLAFNPVGLYCDWTQNVPDWR